MASSEMRQQGSPTVATSRPDYYATLGVERDATLPEIHGAYADLMEAHACDGELVTEATRAYAVLRDPDRRLIYNQLTGKAHRVVYCPFCSDYDPDAWRTSTAGNFCLTIEDVRVTVYQYGDGPRVGGWGYVYGDRNFWQGEPFSSDDEARRAAKAAAARAIYQCCTEPMS